MYKGSVALSVGCRSGL